MTQEREYAQDEEQKRFKDGEWDRTKPDDSWKGRVAESQADAAAEEQIAPIATGVRSVTLQSTKYQESLDFYHKFLGCTIKYDIEVGRADPPMRQATLIAPSGFNINITSRGKEHAVPEDRWAAAIRMTFEINSRDEARARIDAMGIREYEAEFEGPYGPVFTVLDPDNNLINLLYPSRAPKD